MDKRFWLWLGLAVASCSTPQSEDPEVQPAERFIAIEAPGFGWSAVQGLGWGSRLAPVLAQIEKVDGVTESRVDWAGRYFLLKLAPGGTPDEVASKASSVLKGAKRLDAAREGEQIAAYKRGEPWMRSGETLKLSEHEAKVLGERFGNRAAEVAGLNLEQTQRLLEVFQKELTSAFVRLKGTDAHLPMKFRQECPALIARVAERCRTFVTDEQAKKIAESLESTFGRGK